MNFNVGDTLTIRSDLEVDKTYDKFGGFTWDYGMEQYKGREAKITSTNDGICYDLDIDGGLFGWTDEMFEENLKNNENFQKYESSNPVIPTVSEVDKCDKISLLNESYLEYIETQNVSTDEKLAIKKFIEYVRKSNIETK